MRAIFVLAVAAIIGQAAEAQQPPRPASPAPGQPSVCPLYVVDGQVIGPAPGECKSVNMVAAPRPDWTLPPADPLARFLYPPELVMAHQEALGLTDKQRSAIQEAVKDAQGRVVDVQFKMSAEVEKLQRLIQAASPDEPKVLDQVNRVLTLERDMKLAQMTLMVRIKSQLTERQQALLDQMRGAMRIDPLTGTPKPGTD